MLGRAQITTFSNTSAFLFWSHSRSPQLWGYRPPQQQHSPLNPYLARHSELGTESGFDFRDLIGSSGFRPRLFCWPIEALVSRLYFLPDGRGLGKGAISQLPNVISRPGGDSEMGLRRIYSVPNVLELDNLRHPALLHEFGSWSAPVDEIRR